MSMVCKICSHKDRLKADKMIIRGETNLRIASKFGCSEAAVRNHRAHVAEALAKGFERRGIEVQDALAAEAQKLLERDEMVYLKSLEYLKDDDGNPIREISPMKLFAIGQAIQRQRASLETMAKLMGKWQGPADVTVNNTTINFVAIAPVVYKALERHPAALKSVQEALLAASRPD